MGIFSIICPGDEKMISEGRKGQSERCRNGAGLSCDDHQGEGLYLFQKLTFKGSWVAQSVK